MSVSDSAKSERVCPRCGDVVEGPPQQKWCGATCKQLAYVQRKNDRISELTAVLRRARNDLDKAVGRAESFVVSHQTAPSAVDIPKLIGSWAEDLTDLRDDIDAELQR